MKKALLYSLLLLSFLSSASYGQKTKRSVPNNAASREQLEKQRLNILDEIKRTKEQLVVLRKNKNTTFEEFSTLQAKLNARKNLISNINKEIDMIEGSIQIASKDVSKLKTELDTLKKQYGEMVRYTYKNRTSADLIVFLFSASSFNDALRRLQYVKQYRNYRADQAAKITNASVQLHSKLSYLNNVKQKKDLVLAAQENQNKILENETQEKDRMMTELKGKEKALLAGLARNKKAAEDLNRAIGIAIKKEIELAQKRAMEERLRQERIARQQEELDRRAANAKRIQEQQLADKKNQEMESQRLALLKKQQEENQKRILIEKQQREEKERKLIQDKKDREEKEQRLAKEQKEREEKEKQLYKLAENQRKEKEKSLALEKQKQNERERLLQLEREKQEATQRQLLVEKQKQEEYQRRLTEEKKRVQLDEQRNANRGNAVTNPRYISSLANAERPVQPEPIAEKPLPNKPNVKVVKSDDYLYNLTPTERQISTSLEASRGNLPWPVEKGYIIEHYGKNKHPLFNIVTENYGVDIKTSRGAGARAVFPGVVSKVLSIPGTGQTVIVNHGTYFTVYAKLSSVSVKEGSKVDYKQQVGTVMTDDDGNTHAHFEIWKVGANGNSSRLNPELWFAQ